MMQILVWDTSLQNARHKKKYAFCCFLTAFFVAEVSSAILLFHERPHKKKTGKHVFVPSVSFRFSYGYSQKFIIHNSLFEANFKSGPPTIPYNTSLTWGQSPKLLGINSILNASMNFGGIQLVGRCLSLYEVSYWPWRSTYIEQYNSNNWIKQFLLELFKTYHLEKVIWMFKCKQIFQETFKISHWAFSVYWDSTWTWGAINLLVLESNLSISVVHWMYSIMLCVGCLGVPVKSTCVEALVLLFKRVCWLQWGTWLHLFCMYYPDIFCCRFKPKLVLLSLQGLSFTWISVVYFISCIIDFDLWRYMWWCM